MKDYIPTILIDFDGVVHSYTGWNDGKLNGPIPNAKEAIIELQQSYKVVIFSTRNKEQIEPWLKEYQFPSDLIVTNEKVPAIVLVDDRAIKFQGIWNNELILEIKNFSPYWETEGRIL